MENYCGKSCEACRFKERLICPGCKAGPGRAFGGDCELAKCCQDRGHNTCATCNQNNWCSKQRNVETVAETRFQKQEWERAKREQSERHVHLLAKSLTVIFFLSVVSLLPGIMSNDLTKTFPVLYAAGQVIDAFLSLVIIVVYFCMGKANAHYRKVAVLMAVVTVGSFFQYWILSDETPGWLFLLKVAEIAVGLLCRYHMCTAHSEILVPVDYTFSEKWMQLWKWYVYIIAATFASIVLVTIFPILGALLVIAIGIGTIVISVVEVVYFCRMMICFRTYARNLMT